MTDETEILDPFQDMEAAIEENDPFAEQEPNIEPEEEPPLEMQSEETTTEVSPPQEALEKQEASTTPDSSSQEPSLKEKISSPVLTSHLTDNQEMPPKQNMCQICPHAIWLETENNSQNKLECYCTAMMLKSWSSLNPKENIINCDKAYQIPTEN